MDDSLETLESLSGAAWYNIWLINKFKKYIKGDILEVGCGIGNFTSQLSQYGKVNAIDINKNYLGKIKYANVKVGFGDIEKGSYFFKNKKFDSIVCLNVLEHIKNDSKAFNNLNRLLKPGGNLILIIPSHKNLFGEIDRAIFHYRRYEKVDLKQLIEKTKLEILTMKRLNLIGGLGWYISGKLLKNTSVDKNKVRLFNLVGPLFLFLEKFYEPPIGTSLLLIARKSRK